MQNSLPGLENTHGPKILATRNTSYLTASKSSNGRKIARMAPILMIFGLNRSRRCDLLIIIFFEKFSNERRRHRGIVVVVIVAVVVAVVSVIVVVGRFWVACIKGTSLYRIKTQLQVNPHNQQVQHSWVKEKIATKVMTMVTVRTRTT